MLSVIKNFAVTFLVSVIIFAIVAYFAFGIVGDMLTKTDDAVVTEPPSGTISEESEEQTHEYYRYLTDENGNIMLDENGIAVTEVVESSYDASVISDSSFNLLFVGNDYQPDILTDYDLSELNKDINGFKVKERGISTDTIILLHIDNELKSFVFTAIPANTKVTCGGVAMMIKNVYNSYGIDFLCEKVKSLTGMNIDYYVTLKISDCEALINTLGGVDFDVPADMNYIDDSQQLEIDLKSGLQHLDGKQALNMLRYNGYTNGNTQRMKVGIDFAKAMISKITSPEYFAVAPTIYSSISYYLTTNLTMDDFISHLELLFAYQSFSITDYTYPGATVTLDNESYFEPDVLSATDSFRQYRH